MQNNNASMLKQMVVAASALCSLAGCGTAVQSNSIVRFDCEVQARQEVPQDLRAVQLPGFSFSSGGGSFKPHSSSWSSFGSWMPPTEQLVDANARLLDDAFEACAEQRGAKIQKTFLGIPVSWSPQNKLWTRLPSPAYRLG